MNNNKLIRLIDFCKLAKPEYSVMYFHKRIEKYLMRLMLKKTDKNLIICMPPRFGKSVLTIQMFIPWCMSFLPDCNFIVAANNLSLAREHVEEIKNIIQSSWYKGYFPKGATFRKIRKKKIIRSTTKSDYLKTLQGGSIKATGMKGLITGFGAGVKREHFGGCLICDDLLKEDDYSSVTKRNAVYKWVKSTIMFRTNSNNVPKIIIMQRLHPEDLVGILIKDEPEKWDVLNLKAFDEEKQCSVWEQSITTQSLLDLKNSKAEIDQYMFYSKFQQEPTEEFTSIIKKSWWKFYEKIEDIYSKISYRIITIDTAYKTKTCNDETVIQLWGFDGGDKAYLMAMEHGRWEFPQLIEKTRAFYKNNRYSINSKFLNDIFIEDKASGTSLAQTLRMEGLPARSWLPKKNEPKDKMSRVLESTRFIANGRVFLPRNSNFTEKFMSQCAEFLPDGSVHDDMVDAMTMAILIWRNYGAK